MKDVLIYTTNREFVHVEEGTGDNLLKEDMKAGFVDYLNWTLYRFEGGAFGEIDGGMLLLDKPCDEKYPDAHSVVWDILKQAYDEINFTPQII